MYIGPGGSQKHCKRDSRDSRQGSVTCGIHFELGIIYAASSVIITGQFDASADTSRSLFPARQFHCRAVLRPTQQRFVNQRGKCWECSPCVIPHPVSSGVLLCIVKLL
jgi:hypothetical protein